MSARSSLFTANQKDTIRVVLLELLPFLTDAKIEKMQHKVFLEKKWKYAEQVIIFVRPPYDQITIKGIVKTILNLMSGGPIISKDTPDVSFWWTLFNNEEEFSDFLDAVEIGARLSFSLSGVAEWDTHAEAATASPFVDKLMRRLLVID